MFVIGRAIVFTVLVLLGLSAPSFADSAQIVNIQVNQRSGNLLVSADLEGVITDEVREAFLSGMPVTFTYKINLRRVRFLMFDKNVQTITVHKTVKYDSLKKEFDVIEIFADKAPDAHSFEKELAAIKNENKSTLFADNFDQSSYLDKRYLVLKDPAGLEAKMTQLKDIPIDILDVLQNKKYYVEVKASMESPGFSAPLNYILFFISFLEFDSNWEYSTAFLVKKQSPPLDRMLGKITK